ncbi:MAG: hypothetical protein WCD37_06875, partial [Chloroflexia bacterium]
MSFGNIYLVTDKLETATQEEIGDLKKRLGMPLPVGYAEFISNMGTGTYCDLLRVYEPARILREYQEARSRWAEHFFWEVGQGVLAKDEVLKCVIFADTIDG